MAGYQGYSLKGDKSSSKQVDKTIGKRKSNKNNSNSGRSFGSQNKSSGNKNNSNSGNSSNGARLGGGLAREAKNKVDKKNKNESSGNKNKVAEILTDFVQDPGGTVKKGGKIANEAVNNFGKGVKDFFMGKGVEEKEEKKKKEEEKIVQKEQEQLVQNNASEQQSEQNTQKEDETKAKTQDDTVYSSQNEWLLSFLNINSNNKGSIREISDEERKIIIDKMEKYWRNNLGRGLSVEYLVNGAVMRCACGKTLFNIVGKDHKVYTDSTEQLAMLNDTDKRLSSGCEMCDYIGYSYAYEDLEWVEKSNIEIGDNNSKALTMNSYMLSTLKQVSNKLETSKHFVNYFNKYKSSESETMAKELENKSKEAENRRLQAQGKPGIIKPVTSGQEFTIGSKLFIYPKFISDIHSDKDAFDTYWETHDFSENCNIDSGVVKRLMTRNFERMSDTEKVWLYRLAEFFILSEDNDTIRNLLNIFIDGKNNLIVATPEDVCALRENFSILLQCADFYLKSLYNTHPSSSITIDIGLRNYMILRYIVDAEIYSISESPIYRIEKLDQSDEEKSNQSDDNKSSQSDEEKSSGNNIVLKHYVKDYTASTLYDTALFIEVEAKISSGSVGNVATRTKKVLLKEINAENQSKWYAKMLIANLNITLLSAPLGSVGVGLSIIWVLLSSNLSAPNADVEWGSESTADNRNMNKIYEVDNDSIDNFIIGFLANVSFIKDNEMNGHFKYILMPSDEGIDRIYNFLENMKHIRVEYKTENRLVKDSLENIFGINKDIHISNKLELNLGGIKMSTDNTNCYRLNRLAEALILKKIKVGNELKSGIAFLSDRPGKWMIDGIEIVKNTENKEENKEPEVAIKDLFSAMTNGIITFM